MKKPMSGEWLTSPETMDLQSHQVDIWRVVLDLPSDSFQWAESTLSADELERASRFHFEKDRSRFIVAHASLRGVLAQYLQRDPKQISFSANEFGKPFLPDHEVEFNLSHSGDYAMIAVTRGRNIGVDIEHLRDDKELETLARRFFSPSEVTELMALPPEWRMIGFFNCWTRKEAYIKARGLGLSLPLDSFDVSLAPGERVMLRATRPDSKDATRWTIRPLEVDSGYAGAIAVKGLGLDFRFWDWVSR
jgi:4'-phosphopantetheinyl transferase